MDEKEICDEEFLKLFENWFFAQKSNWKPKPPAMI